MLLSFSLLAWRIVVRQIDKCIMLLNACCWRILENCDCFISLYAPLSLKYVWSSADGVFNGEKIWSVVLCICLIQNYYAQCSKIIAKSLIQLCERSFRKKGQNVVNFWKRLKWDILSNFQTLWCTVLRQLVIYIFLGPFPRFLLLSKARPRIFNNSYQDIVVLLLLFFPIVQDYSLLHKKASKSVKVLDSDLTESQTFISTVQHSKIL